MFEVMKEPQTELKIVSVITGQLISRNEAICELLERKRNELVYGEWLRFSPAWHAHRRKKLLARPYCEACEKDEATEVHHLTYDFGWLPPFPYLWSICRPCHIRVHDPKDIWFTIVIFRDDPLCRAGFYRSDEEDLAA